MRAPPVEAGAMRRTPLTVLSCLAVAAVAAGALALPPVPTTPAAETPYPSTTHPVTFRTYDGAGHRLRPTQWH